MSYEHPKAWIDDGYMWLRRDQQAGITDSDYAEAMGTDEPEFCRWCWLPVDGRCTDPRCIAADERAREAVGR